MAGGEEFIIVSDNKYDLDVHIVELGHRIECILQMQRIHDVNDNVRRCVKDGRNLRKNVKTDGETVS